MKGGNSIIFFNKAAIVSNILKKKKKKNSVKVMCTFVSQSSTKIIGILKYY